MIRTVITLYKILPLHLGNYLHFLTLIDCVTLQSHLILLVHKMLNHNQRTFYLDDSFFQFLFILTDIHITFPRTRIRRNILSNNRIPQIFRKFVFLTDNVTIQHIKAMLFCKLLDIILIHKLIDTSIASSIISYELILPLVIMKVEIAYRLVIREHYVGFVASSFCQMSILFHQQIKAFLNRIHTI